MKVLHIIATLGSGGAEKLLVDVLPYMNNKGIRSDVLILSDKNNFFKGELERQGIKVFWTGLKSVYSPLQIFKIGKFIKNYDIIHTHLFTPQLWTAIAKIFFGKKKYLITTEHSTYNRRRDYAILKPLDKLMYSLYDRIICITDSVEKELISYLPFLKEKTIVINNGININKFKNAIPYKKEEIIKVNDKNVKIILMVAAMRDQKDHDTLIRAKKYLPDNFHIVFVGDGPRKKLLYDLSSKYKNIHFLGERKDVERIMKTADVFVLSSHWEGFGLAAVEAMAAGLPVIVSNVPGLRDVVGNGGKTFEPRNEKELADLILETLKFNSSTYKATQFKQAQKFSIENMGNRYINIYENILNHNF